MSAVTPLHERLNDLRTHLEAQIRAVIALEQRIAELAALPPNDRTGHIARVHTDLYDIDRGGELVSMLARKAREALDELMAPPA